MSQKLTQPVSWKTYVAYFVLLGAFAVGYYACFGFSGNPRHAGFSVTGK